MHVYISAILDLSRRMLSLERSAPVMRRVYQAIFL